MYRFIKNITQNNIIYPLDKEKDMYNDIVKDKINRSQEIEKYKQQRMQKFYEINNYLRIVEKNKQDIDYLEDIIYELCDHNWKYNYSNHGPHDSSDKVCSNCNLHHR